MSDFYQRMQGVSSKLLKQFNQGVIKYTVETASGGDPFNPTPASLLTYNLSAVARGVEQKYIKEGYISASDIQVTAAVLGGAITYVTTYTDTETGQTVTTTNTLSSADVNNWFAFYFAPYAGVSEPTINGVIEIDGKEKQIIAVQQIPAAGLPVSWLIFCKS